ncbi:MAG: AMP-binding protein [Desulfovermiculus sp.]|nr:AMP-binding protein [Desulfovermiculus sp.]
MTRRVNYEPLSPLHFLERSAYAFPEKTAIIYEDTTYTYAQFKDRVRRLATALKKRGIGKDDKVAFLCPNIPPTLEAHQGVPLLSAVLVTINIRLSSQEISYILQDSGSKILFVDTELASSIEPILDEIQGIEIVNVCDVQGKAFSAPDYEEFIDVQPENFHFGVDDELQPITINYTSGTNGRPKGVIYSHRGTYLNALSEVYEYHIHHRSKYLWTLPMFHCNGWCHTWGINAPGATHICLRKVVPEDIFAAISKHRATHLCGAPVVLSSMADYAGKNEVDVPEGFIISTAGAPSSPAIIRQMESIGCNVTQFYGLTEVYGPHSFCAWKEEWDDLPLEERAKIKARQGVPYVTTSYMDVVDIDTMQPVPHDGQTIGEIVMWGNNVMLGYHNKPQETEKAFHGGVFHSGDLAVTHPDGYVEIKDRLKDIIISGGENISSVEVENIIYEHPDVLEVAVVGIPHEKWQEVPKAYIKLKEGGQVTTAEITAFCKERIARFKVPKEMEFGELPKTATGKIQKHRLRVRE